LSALILTTANSFVAAAYIQYETIPGANIVGEPVKARASFTTSLNTISVLLENLQADPNSVKQVIYSLMFLVSSGENSGTIASITAFERTVSGSGTYANGPLLVRAGGLIDWDLNTSGTQLHLDRLTNPGQKKHGIIGGPNVGMNEYDDANGSIAGNGPHNSFFGGQAIFVMNVPGVTAASTISEATFAFNTEAGFTAPGQLSNLIPEPSTVALGFIGAAMGMVWGLRKKLAAV